MKLSVKFKTIIYCIVVLLLLSSILVVSRQKVSSYAATTSYFSAEKYTESDKLLNDDGTESTKNIQTFAKETKSAYWNDLLPELPNVIPRQYLETTETKAVFAFNGKEYGFYMTKNSEYFELLLIDFVYNYDDQQHSDLEYRIRIEPILQLAFIRHYENGEYNWSKYVIHDSKYYVANPRFVTSLHNENALNFNDVGYSKEKDDGLIISQFRVNYGKICYANEEDLKNTLLKFSAEKLFDVSCTVLDELAAGTGTVCSILKDVCDLCDDLYDVGRETTALADNENNIETRMSKTAQREDTSKKGYSRIAAFRPREEIILSDDSNSYAEMIVVLNDVNYKSRLTQVCEFDIIRRETDFSSPEYVTGAEDDPSYTIVDTRVIFDDQQPNFEINRSNFDSVLLPIYVLHNGEQKICFTPQYSGEYNFELPMNAELYLNGVKNNTFSLQANQTYVFKIISANNKKVIGNLSCFVESYSTTKSYTVLPNSNKIISYCATETEFKIIKTSNSNCNIALLDENMNFLTDTDSNTVYYNLLSGRKYYFVISNNSSNVLQTNIIINSLNEMSLGFRYSALDNQLMRFTNNYDTSVYFKLTLENGNIASASVTDKFGSVMSMEFETIDDCTVYTFLLASKETYYVRFAGTLNSNTFGTMTINPTQCVWKINGDAIHESTISLKPNATYTVQMDLYIGNVKLETINSFVCYSKGIDCSQSTGQLRIGKIVNGEIIVLVPRIAPDFGLTITVDDMIRKIKLVHCNETQEFEEIEVELGQKIEGVAMPIWKGHTFLGYFDAEKGEGVQYVDKEINGVKALDIFSPSTLYAHWETNTYTLTIRNTIIDFDHTYRIKYGGRLPDLSETSMEEYGYDLIGIYDGPNGTGKQYYHMIWFDDVKTAYMFYSQHFYCQCSQLNSDVNSTVTGDITLYLHYKPAEADYECFNYWDDDLIESCRSQTFHIVHGENTIRAKEIDNYEFVSFNYGGKEIKEQTITIDVVLKVSRSTPTFYWLKSLTANYSKKCVAQGTLITLADGTQVPVESLKGDEMLLVWNMLTGEYDASRILFVDSDPAQVYKVINLGFSDGTTVKVISEHGFWDYDLNEYVYLRQDASKYIGHWFNKGDIRVQLTSVEVRDEYTTAYSPVTYGHLCYFVNGMLSMPGGIEGLFNIFEVDPDTMKVNAEAMARDIETYGLFSYEEFAELLPVTEDVFNAFNGQYLKVAMGKGLITVEQLGNLVNRYSQFFENISQM